MELKGQGSKSIIAITAYRPCKGSVEGNGDKTVYMQHFHTLLHQANATSSTKLPDLHHHFIYDLQAWIEMLQSKGSSIILYVDGNEDTANTVAMYAPLQYNDGTFVSSPSHNGTLSTLVTTCGLIDMLQLQHQPPLPSTYVYGKNRIDFIYVSHDLVGSIRNTGVLPLYSVFQGDHLLDPRKVDKYISHMVKQMRYHKV
jgi:hypothetical protein